MWTNLIDWRLLITTLLLPMLSTCVMMGCEGSGKKGGVTTQDAQAFLQDGKFKGHGEWSQGGAPLSIGQKTVFWIGPESAVFKFNGEFDFTKPEQDDGEITIIPISKEIIAPTKKRKNNPPP